MAKNQTTDSKASRPTIQSLDRGLQLLAQVVNSAEPLGLSELAEFLGLEKSSIHRLMATLITRGFVVQDSHKCYLPGLGIMELAAKVRRRHRLHELADVYVNELAQQTGETAHLAILRHDKVVFTNNVSSDHPLSVNIRVGQAEPLHCTALGKALLCNLENDQIKTMLGRGRLEKFTDNTIGTVSGFLKQCEQVRASLIAQDDEEYRLGIRCLATPVFDFSGKVVATIGISGPTSRLTDQVLSVSSEVVKTSGQKLSEALGYFVEPVDKQALCVS